MKRLLSAIGSLLILLPGASAQWYLVENFEGAELEWWEVFDNPEVQGTYTFDQVVDPADASNTAIRVGVETPGQRIAPQVLLTAYILDGQTGTIYQRVRSEGRARNINFGVSDIWVEGTIDFWGDFELLMFMTENAFGARNARQITEFNGASYSDDVWYEVWQVVRNSPGNASDTFDIYIRGGSEFPEQTLVAQDYAFRNGSADTITKYAIIALNGTQPGGDAGTAGTDTMLFDDIHVALGQVLSTPGPGNISIPADDLPGRVSGITTGGGGGGETGWFFDEQLGWLYDDGTDWEYSLFLGPVFTTFKNSSYLYHPKVGWIFVASGSASSGIWLYSFDAQYAWIYTTDTLGGWFQAQGLEWGWENFTQ